LNLSHCLLVALLVGGAFGKCLFSHLIYAKDVLFALVLNFIKTPIAFLLYNENSALPCCLYGFYHYFALLLHLMVLKLPRLFELGVEHLVLR
jgi:hypothetical protein